jgi:hypothetical protein
MKYLEQSFATDFFAVLNASGVKAELEHIAIHTNNINFEVDFLTKGRGFVCVFQNDICAFLKKGAEQIELIYPENAPEHAGWKVETIEDFNKVYEAFGLQGENSFTLVPEHTIDRDDLRAVMFLHLNGAYVQIVWREKNLFPVESK